MRPVDGQAATRAHAAAANGQQRHIAARQTAPERPSRSRPGLAKAPTGIRGLDEITFGGLPRGRTTLVCGGTGCGKTMLALEFLVRGAALGEPGVLMSFEEKAADIAANAASLGFDLDGLVAKKLLAIDFVKVDPSEIEVTGMYNLDGLFIRLGHAIDTVGAKRVVLDTIESLFGGLSDQGLLRAEIRRLFVWLKTKGVTAIITGERGERTLTRQGLEEYVSDCVIALDHQMVGEISTRKLRIVKYRGSVHGTNDYPFIIDQTGISVLPITSLGLDQKVPRDRVSTGHVDLDRLTGGGYYRGSSVLISGGAGTGKTTLAMIFAAATCERGERCLYFAFEESASQLVRNMASVGLELDRYIRDGLLRVENARPTVYGLETHLVSAHRAITEHQPTAAVIDPISSLLTVGDTSSVRSILTRLMDHLRGRTITTLMTSLTQSDPSGSTLEASGTAISSQVDTWLLLQNVVASGERDRTMFIMKARGSAHSNQLSEFSFDRSGLHIASAYVGPAGALTGSARKAQEARDQADAIQRRRETDRARHEYDRARVVHQAKLAQLQAEYDGEYEALQSSIEAAKEREQVLDDGRAAMMRSRGGDGRASPREKR
ncbi:MAG TPA: circadian clock protein KaiC [Candidatus Limnocylindria bacterium]|nr:circadian clock protein KaiC [Candidatus Limnocylindria bacterium]